MRRCVVFLSVALLCVALAALWSPAHAQFGFIGEKIKQKAQEKTEEAIDKAEDGSDQTNEAQARHDYFVALARLERYTGRPLFAAAAPQDPPMPAGRSTR